MAAYISQTVITDTPTYVIKYGNQLSGRRKIPAACRSGGGYIGVVCDAGVVECRKVGIVCHPFRIRHQLLAVSITIKIAFTATIGNGSVIPRISRPAPIRFITGIVFQSHDIAVRPSVRLIRIAGGGMEHDTYHVSGNSGAGIDQYRSRERRFPLPLVGTGDVHPQAAVAPRPVIIEVIAHFQIIRIVSTDVITVACISFPVGNAGCYSGGSLRQVYRIDDVCSRRPQGRRGKWQRGERPGQYIGSGCGFHCIGYGVSGGDGGCRQQKECGNFPFPVCRCKLQVGGGCGGIFAPSLL